MIFLILIIAILIFLAYLMVDLFITGSINSFIDKWLRYTLFLWLPFYALWRLTREIIFKKE